MVRACLCFILLGLVGWVVPAWAEIQGEQAYVIDRLLIGVHKDKDLESEIVEVLPTGTKLEVLQREQGLAQIRGPKGETGWVDAAYLMQEQPAAQVAEALEVQNKALTAEIASLREQLQASANPQGGEVGSGGSAPSAGSAKAGAASAAPDRSLVQALEEERRKIAALERELAVQRASGSDRSVSVDARRAERLERPESNDALGRVATLSPVTLVMAVALILTVGFAAGVYVTDYLHRRRHGGFRV